MPARADAILSAPPARVPLGVGAVAADLAKLVGDGEVLFAAADEQAGIAVMQALAAAAPSAAVFSCRATTRFRVTTPLRRPATSDDVSRRCFGSARCWVGAIVHGSPA